MSTRLTGEARTDAPAWKYWWAAGALLAAVALFLPFEWDEGGSTPAWFKVVSGWIFVLTGETYVWLSGPLMLAAWIALGMKKPSAAIVFASLALGVALPFLYRPVVTYGWGDFIHHRAQTPQAGYYVGVASMFCSLVAAVQMKRGRGEPLAGRMIALCALAILGPVSLIGATKAVRPHMEAARTQADGEQRIAAEIEKTAKLRAKHWTRQDLPREQVNAVAHGRVGHVPGGLRVKRMGAQAEIINNGPEAVQVEMWFTYSFPSGTKVVCNFFPPKGTPVRGGFVFGLGPEIAPGESALVAVNAPDLQLYDICVQHAAAAPLEFAIRSADRKRLLFLSDSVFGPAPPPHAEWIVEYRR